MSRMINCIFHVNLVLVLAFIALCVSNADGSEIKVVGAGFGRTGTMSLKIALEKVGFGPSFHMSEVFAKPSVMITKWKEVVTLRGNDTQKSKRQEILRYIYNGYSSAVDFPSCLFVDDIVDMNPKTKVILLTRDFDSWYTSARQSIFTFYQRYPSEMSWGEWAFKTFDPTASSLVELIEIMFNDLFHDVRDKEQTRKEYEGWVNYVKSKFNSSQLLVMDLKKANYKDICEFLKVEQGKCPIDEPFPVSNDQEQFKQLFRSGEMLGYLYIVILFMLAIASIVSMIRIAKHPSIFNKKSKFH